MDANEWRRTIKKQSGGGRGEIDRLVELDAARARVAELKVENERLRAVMRDPEVLPEYYDEDGDGHNLGVGWDLSGGCKVSIGPDDNGEWTVQVSMSDGDQRKGITLRSVTRRQVREYARSLLDLVGADDDTEPSIADRARARGLKPHDPMDAFTG